MVRSNRTKKRRKALIIVSLCLAALGIGAAGYSGYLIHKANTALHQMAAGPFSFGQEPQPGHTSITEDEWRPMTFLLTGVDHREGSGGSMNADVLMLVSLNPKTKSATVVSIPRDLEMKPKQFGLPAQKINY